MLKVNFPDSESEHEADALAQWGGDGAVRLLASDGGRRALLVERCQPGTPLWGLADEHSANEIALDALRRLWRLAPPDHPFRLLTDEATRWANDLPERWEQFGRPFERAILDEALAFLADEGQGYGEAFLLHQDFHGGNLLRAAREPWLAIDPKPLVGDRVFDTASLVRDRRWELVRDPDARRRMERRLDHFSSELALDRERMRGWALAHALSWGLDDTGVEEEMIYCARLLAAA